MTKWKNLLKLAATKIDFSIFWEIIFDSRISSNETSWGLANWNSFPLVFVHSWNFEPSSRFERFLPVSCRVFNWLYLTTYRYFVHIVTFTWYDFNFKQYLKPLLRGAFTIEQLRSYLDQPWSTSALISQALRALKLLDFLCFEFSGCCVISSQ